MRWSRLCALLLASAAILAALHVAQITYSVRTGPITWSSSSGSNGTVHGPVFQGSHANDESSVFSYRIVIDMGSAPEVKVQIIPDDILESLRLNGAEVDLSQYPPSALRDYRHGISFVLSRPSSGNSYLIEAGVRNAGGAYGFKIDATGNGPYVTPLKIVTVLMAFLAAGLLMRWLGFPSWLIIVGLIGIGLRLGSFAVTAPTERAHDVGWHLKYIHEITVLNLENIRNHWAQHPPTYYIIALLLQAMLFLCGVFSVEAIKTALQLFSFVCAASCLIIVLDILKLVREELPQNGRAVRSFFQPFFVLITLVSATWPSYIIHAPRIGNEPLAYLFCMWAMRFWMLWHIRQQRRSLAMFALFATLGSITKFFGFILFLAFFLVEVLHAWRGSDRKMRLRGSELTIGAFLLAGSLLIAFTPACIDFFQGLRGDIFIGEESSVSEALRVGNRALNFLWFDLKMFITSPFVSPWQDETGRQFFPNYLGKTSLFGEFSFPGAVLENSAVVLSWTWVALMLMLVWHLFFVKSSWFERFSPAYVLVGLSLLAIGFIRAVCPVNIDFRYIAFIQPAVATMLLLVASCDQLERNVRLGYLFKFMLLVCAIGNVVFDTYFIYSDL